MNKPEYVAYSGTEFTIEWYFDSRGRSQAWEYFQDLPDDRQDEALALFRRMAEHGRIFDIRKFRSEGDKIFAFKPQPDRYLCFFFVGRKIVITNAFEKRGQKLPIGEKSCALRARMDFETRVKRGFYYEKY